MKVGDRVQLPAWSDAWMQGDRYGTIERFGRTKNVPPIRMAYIRLDKSKQLARFRPEDLGAL